MLRNMHGKSLERKPEKRNSCFQLYWSTNGQENCWHKTFPTVGMQLPMHPRKWENESGGKQKEVYFHSALRSLQQENQLSGRTRSDEGDYLERNGSSQKHYSLQ